MSKPPTETKPEIHATFIMPGTGDLMKDSEIIASMRDEISALGKKFADAGGIHSVKPVRRRVEVKAQELPAAEAQSRRHTGSIAA